jgi:hypothetical protein
MKGKKRIKREIVFFTEIHGIRFEGVNPST